jgi:hypothetical protein
MIIYVENFDTLMHMLNHMGSYVMCQLLDFFCLISVWLVHKWVFYDFWEHNHLMKPNCYMNVKFHGI